MIPRELKPSWPAQMLQDPRPKRGDILINRLDGSRRKHTLRVMPNQVQIECGTYDEALGRATRFAKQVCVDVWVAEEEDRFALVGRYRADVQQA